MLLSEAPANIGSKLREAQEAIRDLRAYVKVLTWLNNNPDKVHPFWYKRSLFEQNQLVPRYTKVWTLVFLMIRNSLPNVKGTLSDGILYYLTIEPHESIKELLCYEQPDFNMVFVSPDPSPLDMMDLFFEDIEEQRTPEKRPNTQARKKKLAPGGKKSKDVATRALQFDALLDSPGMLLQRERL